MSATPELVCLTHLAEKTKSGTKVTVHRQTSKKPQSEALDYDKLKDNLRGYEVLFKKTVQLHK